MTSIETLVDRQLSRLALRQREPRAQAAVAAAATSPLRVITVSRQMGSGGHMLASRLATSLNFEFIDRQVIDFITQNTGAQAKLIDSLDERTRSGIDLWVEGILRGRYVDRPEYIRWLIKSITAMAEHGNAIILGRAGNVILAKRGGLHVRAVAPKDFRIENLVRHEGISAAEARRRIDESDEQRQRLYHEDFGADIDDPLGYHLVLNMERLTMDEAIEIVREAWRQMIAHA
jgi:cytidylate kinase